MRETPANSWELILNTSELRVAQNGPDHEAWDSMGPESEHNFGWGTKWIKVGGGGMGGCLQAPKIVVLAARRDVQIRQHETNSTQHSSRNKNLQFKIVPSNTAP